MTDLSSLSLSGLAHRCRRETDRYFRARTYDPTYCLEILRKALSERDEQAWGLIFQLYHRLVLSWVRKHPSFNHCGEEDEFFVNRAFERMWKGLPPEKFKTSSSLPELMSYLKLCVHSSIIDHLRKQGPPPLPEDPFAPTDPAEGPEMIVEKKMDHRELWNLLNGKTKNEQESCFLFAYITLDMKPREILKEYPDVFEDINRVHRTRENLFARLRRDPDLKRFSVIDD